MVAPHLIAAFSGSTRIIDYLILCRWILWPRLLKYPITICWPVMLPLFLKYFFKISSNWSSETSAYPVTSCKLFSRFCPPRNTNSSEIIFFQDNPSTRKSSNDSVWISYFGLPANPVFSWLGRKLLIFDGWLQIVGPLSNSYNSRNLLEDHSIQFHLRSYYRLAIYNIVQFKRLIRTE